MKRRAGWAAFVVFAAGCGPAEAPSVVEYPVPGYARVEVRPETRIVVNPSPGAPGPAPEPTSDPPGSWPRALRTEVVVTTARKLDRATEVVGVIDEHEPSGRQDAAFALLRQRASQMGADAVVGVEFHHGEEKNEPTHLSGLAVRYVDR